MQGDDCPCVVELSGREQGMNDEAGKVLQWIFRTQSIIALKRPEQPLKELRVQ